MVTHRRTFILRNTHLQRPVLTPEVRLRLADAIVPVWRLVAEERGATEVPPPYWAVAWVGGLAVARYLLDHPAEVAGRRVVDFATGSGLCAIAAMKAGAARALAADIDAYCAAAVRLNARANGVRVAFTGRDLLNADPPETDVLLVGDSWYEEPVAARLLPWLRVAQARGMRVLIGDPGRAYFPRAGLLRLAAYDIPTTRELEGFAVRRAGVFTFPA